MPYNAAQLSYPSQATIRQFYGEPGGAQCTAGLVDLPYKMRIAWSLNDTVGKFRCHSKVETPLERIFQKTLAHYGEAEIKRLGLDLFGGCYNLRKMRGGSSWSMHSWGIAVDLDPAHNALKMTRKTATFAKDIYVPFWNIVESEGAVSLGLERDFDWMHFQFARL